MKSPGILLRLPLFERLTHLLDRVVDGEQPVEFDGRFVVEFGRATVQQSAKSPRPIFLRRILGRVVSVAPLQRRR
jgi:hypothetical protein